MVAKIEDHTLRVTADSVEAVLEEEEDTESQSQPDGLPLKTQHNNYNNFEHCLYSVCCD